MSGGRMDKRRLRGVALALPCLAILSAPMVAEGETPDLSIPVRAPDGMRAANGKLFQAANGSGRIDALTITGDTAHVTVLKDGLLTPTGIEPAGDTLWFTERGTGKVWSIPMPK